MNATNLTIRLDRDLKNDAESLFADLGMSISTAFNIFLRQAIRVQGLPFAVTKDIPNADTIAAMEEGNRIAHDPAQKRYTLSEALAELKK